MSRSALKETGNKRGPAPAELTNGHGLGPFSRRHRAAELREKRVLIAFEFDGESYEAVYNHAGVTIGFNRSMRELDAAGSGEQISAMLAALLLDWDLVQEDGETPLPCSVEEIERQPPAYLGALVTALWKDYNGEEAPGEELSETP